MISSNSTLISAKNIVVAALLSLILLAPSVLLNSEIKAASDSSTGFESSISKQDFVHHGSSAKFVQTNNKDQARNGNRALKIFSTNSDRGTRTLSELTRWMTDIRKHEVSPGERVRVDVYMKTKDVKDTAAVALSFFGDKGNGSWGSAWVKTATSAKRLSGDQNWTKITLNSIAPKGAKYVRPEFRLWDRGTLWIDDFRIRTFDAQNTPDPEPDDDGGSGDPGPVVTPDPEPQPDPEDPGDDGGDGGEGDIQGAIPYEGPNQYNFNVVPIDEYVATTVHGINKGRGQQLFTVDCKSSHFRPDDPIVFPDGAGASHTHEFFGDVGLNASSTTQDILDSKDGNTCEVGADRSAYWTPAAYQDGKRVEADNNKFYYKVGQVDPKTIQPMPVGLRMIAGNANATGPQSKQAMYYFATSGEGKTTEPKTQVSSGTKLFTTRANENGMRIRIAFPQCWDGEYLWLPKTAHMSYAVNGKCPDTHPVPLLQLIFNIGYTDAYGGDGFKLSSGDWFTAHADFINGWHPTTFERLVDVCLRDKRYCGLTRSEDSGTRCNAKSAVRTNRLGCIELRRGEDFPRFFGREY